MTGPVSDIAARVRTATARVEQPDEEQLVSEECLDVGGVDADSVRRALAGRRAGALTAEDIRELSHSTSFISDSAFAYYLGDMIIYLDREFDKEAFEEMAFISMAIRRRLFDEEFTKKFASLIELRPELLSWLQKISPE